MDFLSYFENAYIGRKVGDARRLPKFPIQFWNVLDRHHTGSLRTCNAVEAAHKAFVCGIARAHHPSIFKFLEDLHCQQAIAQKEIVEINMGEEKKVRIKEENRNQRLKTLVQKYEEDHDALHLCRGVAHNYM